MAAVLIPEPSHASEIDAIADAVKAILVNELRVAVTIDGIDADASLEELDVDSVAMIELISAVEARFDFAFLDSDLVSSSFASVRALSEVIAKRIHAAAAAAAS
jgi:acyl carrier protein